MNLFDVDEYNQTTKLFQKQSLPIQLATIMIYSLKLSNINSNNITLRKTINSIIAFSKCLDSIINTKYDDKILNKQLYNYSIDIITVYPKIQMLVMQDDIIDGDFNYNVFQITYDQLLSLAKTHVQSIDAQNKIQQLLQAKQKINRGNILLTVGDISVNIDKPLLNNCKDYFISIIDTQIDNLKKGYSHERAV